MGRVGLCGLPAISDRRLALQIVSQPLWLRAGASGPPPGRGAGGPTAPGPPSAGVHLRVVAEPRKDAAPPMSTIGMLSLARHLAQGPSNITLKHTFSRTSSG